MSNAVPALGAPCGSRTSPVEFNITVSPLVASIAEAALPLAVVRSQIVFAPDERRTAESTNERPRILIVEDEYLVAVQIESSVTDAGFEVAGTASTAAEAVALAKAVRPALVVMDIRLVGQRDGIDAAIEIYKTTGIRCIFASAYSDFQTRQRAVPASPVGWLAKPYRMDTLVGMIRDALKNPQD